MVCIGILEYFICSCYETNVTPVWWYNLTLLKIGNILGYFIFTVLKKLYIATTINIYITNIKLITLVKYGVLLCKKFFYEHLSHLNP